MGIRRWFTQLFQSSEQQDALDWPDLRRQVVDGILRLKQRGKRGVEVLPPVLSVVVVVAEGSVKVVQRFIDNPEFDAEVEADLLNRLVMGNEEALPIRLYSVEAGSKLEVTVSESTSGVVGWLVVQDQETPIAIGASQAEVRIGRGQWHGNDETLTNDVPLPDVHAFISRRAAILRRAGSFFDVESLDQGEFLVVVRASKRIRPINTRKQRVRLQTGDSLEFNDGGSQSLLVEVRDRRPDSSPD